VPDSANTPGRLRFGVFEADLQSGELTRRGRRVRLQEQPLSVLVMLLQRPGELVTREELQSRLWPDTTVDFDHGLNKAISKIREALADSALSPRFIETVSRRGYRFIGDVVAAPPAAGEAEPSGAPARASLDGRGAWLRRPVATWTLTAAAVGVLLAGGLAWTLRPTPRRDDAIRSLAVLPLANFSGDASQDYFADGMTDELTSRLGQFGNLRIISRTSAMAYGGARKSLPEIAHELHVDAVVEGSVVRSGDRVRINVDLISAATDQRLWGQSYAGDLRDTLTLQDGVARDIAEQVRATLGLQPETTAQTSVPVEPEAFDDYLKARSFLDKRTGDGLRSAIIYFSHATVIDPNFAEAYAGMADAYALAGDWEYGVLPPAEAFAEAKAAANRALTLNEGLSEAHTALAFALDLYAWDWKSAEREYLRAIELNPNYPTAHQWYGWHLMVTGRTDKGIEQLRIAESLDPMSAIIGADLADALTVDRRYADSIRQSEKTLEIDPSFALAYGQLGQTYTQEGQYGEAISALNRAIALGGHSGAFDSQLAYADALAGRAPEARTILADMERRANQSPSIDANVALVYVGLGDHDAAIAWLDKAYAAHFNPSILVRRAWDPIRSDERFKALWNQMGLPT
jgi:TolB-like protein/DNA-binding winged helix-turn-helix (wHTH) protein/tetratricopeptide (TPR) repeat protein